MGGPLQSASLIDLISPQLHGVKHTLRSSAKTWKLPFFLILTFLCLWGCYLAGDFLFAQLMKVSLIAELLIQKTMGFIFNFFWWVLLFSTLISAFSTHYLSQDLTLLVHAPISGWRLFYARSVSAWGQTSWMVLLFALPTLASAGAHLDAPLSFYLTLSLCLFTLTLCSATLSCSAALILARLFPAKRTQEALVFILVGIFIYFYIQLNASRPDRFLREDGFEDLIALVKGLKEVGGEWGVSAWSSEAIFSTLREETPYRWTPLLSLLLMTGGAVTLSGLLAQWLYLPGYWLSQEGLGRVDSGSARRALPRYASTVIKAITSRENLTFWRTPAQWTQLLLVGSLVIVYIFNFKYFNALHQTGFFTELTLFMTHMGLSGMVMITLAARFLYPSISGEGKALWVLQSAPIYPKMILDSKVKWAQIPLVTLSISLSLIGAWLTELQLSWMIATTWGGVLLAFGVLGLGIGMGAANPRFNLPNPMMVASSLGGISFMLIALLYLFALIILSYLPGVALTLALEASSEGASFAESVAQSYNAWGIYPYLSWVGANLLSIGVYLGSLYLGARRLERLLLDDVTVEG